jgi:predicted transcriptional regulator
MGLKIKIYENCFRVSNNIFDYKLSAGAFQLYCYLLFDNKQISNEKIKKQLNIKNNSTIAKYWTELLDKKLITRTRIINEKNQVIGGFNYIIKEL